jgi:hypothetical protein
MVSYELQAQDLWVTSDGNIVNNTGGGVRVRQDAASTASVPAHGNWALFSWGSSSHTSGTAYSRPGKTNQNVRTIAQEPIKIEVL